MARGMIPSKTKAFTLVELLVSMAISSVLLLTLAMLMSQATDGYALSQRSIDQITQARAVFHLIETDLSSRLPDAPLAINSDPKDRDKGSNQISLVSVMAGYEQNPEHPGDLATICYYVAYDQDPARETTPKLYRRSLDSAGTQERLEKGIDAPIEPDPDSDEPVLDGVLKFQAKLYATNPASGLEEAWQASSNHEPTHLELTLTIVDRALAKRLRDRSDWERIADSPKDSELQMIRTFTRKISIGR